jgi:cystathionine beta-synthase
VDLLRALVTGGKTFESPIAEVVENDYATVTPNTKIELLQSVLADAKVAIVEDAGLLLGIVTKIDLIDFLAKAAQKPSVAPQS